MDQLVHFQALASPLQTSENNITGSKVILNKEEYYPLFAQFGRNRFNFNPAPPKKGVNIQKNYSYKHKPSEFPQILGRNYNSPSTGNLLRVLLYCIHSELICIFYKDCTSYLNY